MAPTPVGKKPLGNWPAAPLKKSISFAFHVPDDAVGSVDSAKIVVISLKDGDISYQINTSLAVNGDALFADPPETVESSTGNVPLVLTMTAGELTEISVPLPTLVAGDYFSVNFLKKSKAKLVVVGLRYTYNADFNKNGSSLYYNAGNVGIGTSAPQQRLHVQGGNAYVSGSLGLGDSTPDQKLDVVGNGAISGNLALGTTNALQKLDVRGNDYFSSRVGITTSAPIASLDIRSGSSITLSKSQPGYALIGNINGFNLALDSNEVTARNNGAASTLWLNPLGGIIRMASTSSTSRVSVGTSFPAQKLDVRGNVIANLYLFHSDRRLKKNIETLGSTLDKVMALKPAKYHFKTQGDSSSKHFGLIAQELKEVFPEMVSVQEGSVNGVKGMHAVAYTELIPVLIKGMQEQQTIIQNMQAKLDRQQKQQVAYQELEGMVRKMQLKLDRLEKADWTLAGNK